MVAVSHPLGRDMVEAVLRDMDPPELRTPTLRKIAASSFVTEDLLERLVVRLQRHVLPVREPLVLDLGCGGGGVGMWIAEQFRTRLVGIDRDDHAVRRARGVRPLFGLSYEPSFHRATFEWTGLAPHIVDAIVSLDALCHARDISAALHEARRVLVPGGALIFDVYVDERDRNAWKWVRALLDAGFDITEIDDQTDAWRAVIEKKHEARLACGPYLIRRLGDALAADELARSRNMAAYLTKTRRIELVAMSRG